jgi:hypothetical protein
MFAEMTDDTLTSEFRAKAKIDDCCNKFINWRCHCLVRRRYDTRSEALIL